MNEVPGPPALLSWNVGPVRQEPTTPVFFGIYVFPPPLPQNVLA
jgi:hypothetical protein